MINCVILRLGSNERKVSGLLKHYFNSKFFSEDAYEDVLKRVKKINSRAYAIHVLECIENAEKFAKIDFPGIHAYGDKHRNSNSVKRGAM